MLIPPKAKLCKVLLASQMEWRHPRTWSEQAIVLHFRAALNHVWSVLGDRAETALDRNRRIKSQLGLIKLHRVL